MNRPIKKKAERVGVNGQMAVRNARPSPAVRKVPKQIFRVEGLGRKGTIRFVKVVGTPGEWRITGLNGLSVQVAGNTVDDALKLARRKIPFRPFAIRALTGTDSQ